MTVCVAGGDVYEGDWLDSQKHGKGVYTYTSGARYEGSYREDKMDGYGVYTYG